MLHYTHSKSTKHCNGFVAQCKCFADVMYGEGGGEGNASMLMLKSTLSCCHRHCWVVDSLLLLLQRKHVVRVRVRARVMCQHQRYLIIVVIARSLICCCCCCVKGWCDVGEGEGNVSTSVLLSC